MTTRVKALAYETKDFIDEDDKDELKQMHLKIQGHEADFTWFQGDSTQAKKLRKNAGEFMQELGARMSGSMLMKQCFFKPSLCARMTKSKEYANLFSGI